MIVSPCISICRTDPVTGYCYGCGRNSEDKIKWKDPDTTNEWKVENLKIIKSRMNGWQLESFNESYEHKIKNGLHYLKKQIKNNMSKTTIAIIIYVLGLIFGALVLDLWSAETSPKPAWNDLDCIISYCFIFCRVKNK